MQNFQRCYCQRDDLKGRLGPKCWAAKFVWIYDTAIRMKIFRVNIETSEQSSVKLVRLWWRISSEPDETSLNSHGLDWSRDNTMLEIVQRFSVIVRIIVIDSSLASPFRLGYEWARIKVCFRVLFIGYMVKQSRSESSASPHCCNLLELSFVWLPHQWNCSHI